MTWRSMMLVPVILGASASATMPERRTAIEPIPDSRWAAMKGVSWTPGCPVGREGLRVVIVPFVDFEGRERAGELVVAASEAPRIADVFERLYAARFPIARMEPIEKFGGDDDASMAANNTSAFNCRQVEGTKTYSRHALGKAIDINPVQNPWVRGERVEPPAGRAFLDREDVRPGMIVADGEVVAAFEAIGWKWGGRWKSSRDYQHFSADGR